MGINVYEQLRANIDLHAIPCHPSPEIIEIFKLIFTKEEATVALGLRFRTLTASDIAKNIGVEKYNVQNLLESMADKGMIFAKQTDNIWKYSLINRITIYENCFRGNFDDVTIQTLRKLWGDYFGATFSEVHRPIVPPFRTIPINEKLNRDEEILPYNNLLNIIDQENVMGITNCACNMWMQNCESPRETCMVFGDTCEWLVQRRIARYLTRDEMKRKLKQFDDSGFVHVLQNVKNKTSLLCNCCTCCCAPLNMMVNYGDPSFLAPSSFRPILDFEICTGCGNCADERCPTKAIEMADEKPVIQIDRCIGCGLCATGCPNGAREMKFSESIPEPPHNFIELGKKILKDRGTYEEFIAFNKR